MGFDFASVKQAFFDSDKVMRAVSRAKRQAFATMGAFVRRRAKSSIRKRKKSSPPGLPPSSHVGTLRNLIFFGWDEGRQSVVVGPVLFPTKVVATKRAPELLEHSGDTVITKRSGRLVHRHYRGNPFMLPALEAERPKFAAMMREQVK